MPDDASPSLPVDPANVTAADRLALADVAAGRLIDSETMTQRLGGWQRAGMDASVAERLPAGPHLPLPTGARADPPCEAVPLVWTHTAAAECERIRQLLAAFCDRGDHRFTAALITTMVRLIVDGPDQSHGIADVPLLPPFALRILIDPDRLTVLGPRDRMAIR